MAKLFLLSLLCVMVVALHAVRNPYDDYFFPSFENDKPAELECDPPCEEGTCCAAQLPLERYTCVPSASAVGRICVEKTKCETQLTCECCVKTVRKGSCYRSSSRCMNPARFAIASNCCKEGKVCTSSSATSMFGRCRTPEA